MIFKLLITCLAVVGLTLGTAISDSVVPKQQGYHYVQLALYHSKGYQCADKAYDQMSIVNETCLPLKAGSLKVLSHAKQLKYNSRKSNSLPPSSPLGGVLKRDTRSEDMAMLCWELGEELTDSNSARLEVRKLH